MQTGVYKKKNSRWEKMKKGEKDQQKMRMQVKTTMYGIWEGK
jgi:hypothetical protein